MTRLLPEFHIGRPVQVLVVVFVAALFILIMIQPAARRAKEAALAVERARGRYLDAVIETRQYAALQEHHADDSPSTLTVPLFSYVDEQARSLGLSGRLNAVRPEIVERADGSTVEIVHIAFTGITLDELVRFLHRVEVQKREIFVKTISMKKDAQRNLDVQMALQKRG